MKIIMISMILALMGAQAHATRARLSALGQDANGSLFIKDERNIFLNPATLSTVSNRVNLEAGRRESATAGALNSPKAEGGFVYQTDSLGLAAQLGRVSSATQRIVTQDSLDTIDFFNPQNSLELLIAGKGGLNWGASLHHAFSKDDQSAGGNPNSEARVLVLRGGVETEKFQVYGTMDVIHESEIKDATPGVTQKYDGNLSVEFGGAYNLSEKGSVGGYVRKSGYDFDDGAAAQGDFEQQAASVAYFHRFQNDENVLVFASGGIFWLDQKSDYDASGVDDVKLEQLSLPVAIGVETKLNTWLKLRGSVTQHVLIHKEDRRTTTTEFKRENFDSTVVTLGTGMTFDKLTLDATLEGSGAAGTGQINGDHLMGNVGVTYEF